MQVSFRAPTKFNRAVQLLVMKYGGYFVRNQFESGYGDSHFCITFDDDACVNYSKFMNKVHILNQPWV